MRLDLGNLSTLYIFTTPFDASNASNATCQNFCYAILYREILDSKVRVWDIIILIPNLLFFVYLLFKIKKAFTLLMRLNLQVFAVLFAMLFVSQSLSILRCIISMTVHTIEYGFADRVMWLILRFVLLSTELSVVTFGFFFGHLDSHSSIKRVVLVTFTISFIHSIIQGALEFLYHNKTFNDINNENEYSLFGHGGTIFWFSSSFVLFMLYAVICLLPLTRLKEKYTFPSKKSFYVYCLVLSILNLAQAVGGVLLYKDVNLGMCIVNLTGYLYFTGFPLLIYFSFLYTFFNFSQSPSMLVPYRTQIDDYDDYHLPHHTPPGEFTNSTDQDLTNNSNFGQSVLSFSHNPLCPSLTSHPDLNVGTPIILTPGHGKDNRMMTFPA